MNILFLLGVYPSYGGVEKVTTILANEFTSRGHHVSIVSFVQPFPEIAEKELNHNVNLYELHYPVNQSSNLSTLRGIVTKETTDVIINQWCVPYYVTRLCRKAIRGTKCKLIAVHHNLPDTNARIKDIEIAISQGRGCRLINMLKLTAVKFVSRLSLRYTYDFSDRYVVLSPSFIPVAKRFICKHDAAKILSIANPLTIEGAGKTDVKKQKEIIYVGRIEDNQKRTYRLLDIWSQLQPDYPDWHFTIVGDGPNRADLESGIRSRNIKNISLEGFKDPKPYYERATLLVLTSEYEGFPLVIVEGMSYGVIPVVYGSYVSVYDIITDGVDGFITPMPYSRDITVSRLRRIMDDPQLAERMSRNAREKSKQFSIDSIVAQWENLFKSI